MSKRSSSTPSEARKLLGHFGLADAGRAGEDVGADRLVRLAQAGTRQLDRGRQRFDRQILTVDDRAQFLLQVGKNGFVVLRDGLRRDARHRRDRRFDLLFGDQLAALGRRQQHLGRTGLVDHVDRLVRQLAVGNVAGRQLDGRLDRLVRVAQVVVLFEIGLQALHDLDRIIDRRLVDVDLLEAANQSAVLLEELAVFLVGGRTDAADRARGQRRLQQVRGIHCAARGGTRTDDRVDFVDEQHGARIFFEFLDDLLQALFEIAAIAGAGQQRAHVEREDRGIGQCFRHLAFDDALGETFGDRRLADAGIADVERVVLGAAAQDLDGPVDLGVAADQRIDLAALGLLVEVDAVGLQRILLLLGAAFFLLAAARSRLALGLAVLGTARRARSRTNPGACRCRGRYS